MAGVWQPFYLVQLTSNEEKEVDGKLASDALATLISEAAASGQPFTHLFVQTHGWSTPTEQSIDSPFGMFVSGMMDDKNRPQNTDFKPLFVCFTWEGQPTSFIQNDEAITRDELLREALSTLSADQEKDERQLNTRDMTEALRASLKRGSTREARRDMLLALSDELDEDESTKFDVERTLADWDEEERVRSNDDTEKDDFDPLGWILKNTRNLTLWSNRWSLQESNR